MRLLTFSSILLLLSPLPSFSEELSEKIAGKYFQCTLSNGGLKGYEFFSEGKAVSRQALPYILQGTDVVFILMETSNWSLESDGLLLTDRRNSVEAIHLAYPAPNQAISVSRGITSDVDFAERHFADWPWHGKLPTTIPDHRFSVTLGGDDTLTIGSTYCKRIDNVQTPEVEFLRGYVELVH